MAGRFAVTSEAPAPPPDVSVVVPTWKSAGHLDAAVASALGQVGVSVELLMVDDASPDDTFAHLQGLAAGDARIRAFRQPQNGGPGAARNAAFDMARGDWIALLDADDAMTRHRLRHMIDLAEAEGADIVLGNLAERDADGHVGESAFLAQPQIPTEWRAADFVAGNLAASGARSYGYLKPLLRRSFVEAHGLRYDPRLRNGEDYHLILSAYAHGARVWFAPAADYLYTRRAGSISHRSEPDHLAALLEAEDRVAPLFADREEVAGLLAQRRQALADMHAAELVMQALKSARLGQAGREVLRRPRATGRVALQLKEAVGKRIGRRTSETAPPAKDTPVE